MSVLCRPTNYVADWYIIHCTVIASVNIGFGTGTSCTHCTLMRETKIKPHCKRTITITALAICSPSRALRRQPRPAFRPPKAPASRTRV